MLSSKFLFRKHFSSIAKIKFQKHAKDAKNYIYFASEKDFKQDSHSEMIRSLTALQPTRMKDIKKQKMGIIYPISTQSPSFFSERLCLAVAPESLDKLRSVASKAFKAMASHQLDSLHVGFSSSIPFHHRRIIATSLIMSNYSFKISGEVKEQKEEGENGDSGESNTTGIQKKKKNNTVNEIVFDLLNDPTNLNKIDSFKSWVNLANSTLYTRALANQRPNVADCDFLEDIARKIVKNNQDKEIGIEVIKGEKLTEKGLNLVYAVGKSAQSAPRVIILTYKGKKSTTETSNTFTHAIVGKGLTFDTGGLNLKPTNYIEDMYLDKHGACNVLSVFKSVVEMELPINLVCAVGAAENSIDSNSYKPSDIITSYKGYTVEITNTDAEGRLVLADTLSYIQDHYKPENIIDLATLTGACMIALGSRTAGLFTNSNVLASHIAKASEEVLESVWHLPINNEHREDIKSPFADLKNAGKDRYGGASKAAAFLEKFINKGVNWVHLDIAGPAHGNAPVDCWPQGSTGFGTQIVLKYLINQAYGGTDVAPEDLKEPVVSTISTIPSPGVAGVENKENDKESAPIGEKLETTTTGNVTETVTNTFPDSPFPIDTTQINPPKH